MNDLEQRIAALEQQLSGGMQRISGKTDVMPGSLQPRLLVPGVQQNGDLYYSNGTNFVRLGLGSKGSLLYANTVPSWIAPGSANQVLTTVNSLPAWVTPNTWTSYTPTITAETGTFTTVSATGSYVVFGKMVSFMINVICTTIGSAATGLIFTLPVVSTGDVFVGFGVNISTGMTLNYTTVSNSSAHAKRYDNSFPITSGQTNVYQGFYQSA